jgi:hypothetical protein
VNQGTCDTMPWLLWSDAVLTDSGASYEASKPHRARLQRWFNAGEPVWMAADGLKQLVAWTERAKREVDPVGELQKVIRRFAT